MTRDDLPLVRVGQGWDLHRLVEGGPLRVGGIDIEHDRAAKGHSDGDVVLHALTDAILGALGAGDIGQRFPDNQSRWRGADSSIFLSDAVDLCRERGFAVGCADVTVILERPKIGPHRERLVERLAELLDSTLDRVSVKAKTNEGLGAIGRGEAVAAMAIVGLVSR